MSQDGTNGENVASESHLNGTEEAEDGGEQLYYCDFDSCVKSFRRRDYLERHQLNHNNEPRLTCHICSRGFHRADVLKKHVERHKPLEERRHATPRRRTPGPVAPAPLPMPTPVSLATTAEAVRYAPQNLLSPPGEPIESQVGGAFRSLTPFVDPYPTFDLSGFTPFGAPNVQYNEDFNAEDIYSWLFTASPTHDLPAIGASADPVLVAEPLMVLAQAANQPLAATGPMLQDHPGPGLSDVSQSTVSDLRVSRAFGGPSLNLESQCFDATEEIRVDKIITSDIRVKMLEPFMSIASVDLDSEAFSLKSLQLYLELYFLHFDPLFPILHRPTLVSRAGGPRPLVLLAMVCIGTAFAVGDSGLTIAKALHQRIRNKVFEMIEDDPRVEVHVLQTILLLSYFSRMYSSSAHHDISQVFHSPSIILANFSGVFLPESSPETATYPPTEEGWASWVSSEERRRIGWFAFLCDTSNAAMFRHTLMVHSFAMKIPFPCSEMLWAAQDYRHWSLRLGYEKEQPSFRNALRNLSTNGIIDPDISAFNAWILLHGCISVSWTLLWRDLADLSMVNESRIGGWKNSLRAGFSAWHQFISTTKESRLTPSRSDNALYWTGVPFCLLGGILLLTETELVRMIAGAPRVAGRLISPGERILAQRKLEVWSGTPDGQIAVWTSLELLHQLFKWSAEARFMTTPSTTPWCCYIAVLIVWAYGSLLEGRRDLSQHSFVIWPSTRTTTATSLPQIEPSLALVAAHQYTTRLLASGGPDRLADVKNKNEVAGVVAYGAWMAGNVPWGTMESPHKELLNLLRPHS
ncbi:hypothetical protein T439DRAFT_383596 [Meredithblackwellia eburnea MCA 4105]